MRRNLSQEKKRSSDVCTSNSDVSNINDKSEINEPIASLPQLKNIQPNPESIMTALQNPLEKQSFEEQTYFSKSLIVDPVQCIYIYIYFVYIISYIYLMSIVHLRFKYQ